jgi:hypothetical protein
MAFECSAEQMSTLRQRTNFKTIVRALMSPDYRYVLGMRYRWLTFWSLRQKPIAVRSDLRARGLSPQAS